MPIRGYSLFVNERGGAEKQRSLEIHAETFEARTFVNDENDRPWNRLGIKLLAVRKRFASTIAKF